MMISHAGEELRLLNLAIMIRIAPTWFEDPINEQPVIEEDDNVVWNKILMIRVHQSAGHGVDEAVILIRFVLMTSSVLMDIVVSNVCFI